jgi:hypothetical protein
MGGRMTISGYWDSSEFSFNNSILSSDINITRKSKGSDVVVKNVRGYCFYKGMHRQAIDIFVGTPLPSTGYTEQQRQIVLTLPIEGKTELNTGVTALCDPLVLDDSNPADTYPSTSDTHLCSETYALSGNVPTGSLSLIRP